MASDSIFPRDRVTIVGVLNLTPDSFSDGGRFMGQAGLIDVDAALAAGEELVRGGARMIDVGGESTRPGAEPVPTRVELTRTIPVIEALSKRLGVPVSIDTRKAEVARAALAAGARVVNDVSGLQHDPALADEVARAEASLIIGHMRGTPATMQQAPHYDDVLREVASQLESALGQAERAGCRPERLAIDPGLGFGKRLEDNLQLISHVGWLRERLGRPVLLGPSRKSFLAALSGDPVAQRGASSLAACAVAAFAGADALRVHEVRDAVRAVQIGRALRDARRKELA